MRDLQALHRATGRILTAMMEEVVGQHSLNLPAVMEAVQRIKLFNSKVSQYTIIAENKLLEIIRLYLYDCSVYLVTALISIGLTTLILRTYLPLFVLRNGSLYAIIRTCSYICTSCLSYIHL